MGNIKPYGEEAGSKRRQVEQMFDNIAPYYDLLNRVLSLGIDKVWRKKAIALLKEHNPKKVLDIATGTGDLALEVARQLQPSSIIGLDISNEMLEIGRKKIAKKQLSNLIQMTQGDSENLAFGDNTFDALTVAFGVRNFEHLEVGLREMYRVLKPGGKVVILEFSRPTAFPFKQLFNGYFKYILPNIGKLTSKDPKAYQYLYESVQAFPEGTDFVNILDNIGFKSNQCKRLSLGICSIYYGFK